MDVESVHNFLLCRCRSPSAMVRRRNLCARCHRGPVDTGDSWNDHPVETGDSARGFDVWKVYPPIRRNGALSRSDAISDPVRPGRRGRPLDRQERCGGLRPATQWHRNCFVVSRQPRGLQFTATGSLHGLKSTAMEDQSPFGTQVIELYRVFLKRAARWKATPEVAMI